MNINIIGADELAKHLDGLVVLDKEFGKVIKKNTALLQNTAQRNATVDTGYMKSKITQNISSNGMEGNVVAEAPYSIHVEFGTFSQVAKPFMRPALNLVIPKFKSDVKDVIGK